MQNPLLAQSELKTIIPEVPTDSLAIVSELVKSRKNGLSVYGETTRALKKFSQNTTLLETFCKKLLELRTPEAQDVASGFLNQFLENKGKGLQPDAISFQIDDIMRTVKRFAALADKEAEKERLNLRTPLISMVDGELAAHRYDSFKVILERSAHPEHDIANLNTGLLEGLSSPEDLERYYSAGHHYIHYQFGRTSKGHLERRPNNTELNIYEAFSKMEIPPPFEVQDEFVQSIRGMHQHAADELIVNLNCAVELPLDTQLEVVRELLGPVSHNFLQRNYLRSIDCSHIPPQPMLDAPPLPRLTPSTNTQYYLFPYVIQA